MFCEVHGIKIKLSALRNPQQNGVVERKKKTIQEATRSMMTETGLQEVYWREAIHTDVYVFN